VIVMNFIHLFEDTKLRIGNILLLKREPENEVDKNAVAVTTGSGKVGGKVPNNLIPFLSQVFQRVINKGTCEV